MAQPKKVSLNFFDKLENPSEVDVIKHVTAILAGTKRCNDYIKNELKEGSGPRWKALKDAIVDLNEKAVSAKTKLAYSNASAFQMYQLENCVKTLHDAAIAYSNKDSKKNDAVKRMLFAKMIHQDLTDMELRHMFRYFDRAVPITFCYFADLNCNSSGVVANVTAIRDGCTQCLREMDDIGNKGGNSDWTNLKVAFEDLRGHSRALETKLATEQASYKDINAVKAGLEKLRQSSGAYKDNKKKNRDRKYEIAEMVHADLTIVEPEVNHMFHDWIKEVKEKDLGLDQ